MALATDKTAVITENLTDAGLEKKQSQNVWKCLINMNFQRYRNFFPIIGKDFSTAYMSTTIRSTALTISPIH